MSDCCSTLSAKFAEEYVAREVASGRKRGPGKTARRMVELIATSGAGADGTVAGATLLDIGAGYGDIQAGLFERGLASAIHLEASGAYSAAARRRVRDSGHADRVRFEVGDVADLAPRLARADIVTLDRVVCCYPDMQTLVDRSAPLARRVLGISAPHDRWYTRLATRWKNFVRRRRGDPFRTFVHPWSAIDARMRHLGFEPVGEARTIVWRTVVYRRI